MVVEVKFNNQTYIQNAKGQLELKQPQQTASHQAGSTKSPWVINSSQSSPVTFSSFAPNVASNNPAESFLFAETTTTSADAAAPSMQDQLMQVIMMLIMQKLGLGDFFGEDTEVDEAPVETPPADTGGSNSQVSALEDDVKELQTMFAELLEKLDSKETDETVTDDDTTVDDTPDTGSAPLVDDVVTDDTETDTDDTTVDATTDTDTNTDTDNTTNTDDGVFSEAQDKAKEFIQIKADLPDLKADKDTARNEWKAALSELETVAGLPDDGSETVEDKLEDISGKLDNWIEKKNLYEPGEAEYEEAEAKIKALDDQKDAINEAKDKVDEAKEKADKASAEHDEAYNEHLSLLSEVLALSKETSIHPSKLGVPAEDIPANFSL